MFIKKKGISPLIATVLLIAFVIVLFLIIAVWIRKSVVEPVMPGTEGKIGTIIGCANTEIELIEACVDDISNPTTITFTVDNIGDTEITNLKVRVLCITGAKFADITSLILPFGRITETDLSLDGECTDATMIEIYPKIESGWCNENLESIAAENCPPTP